jgi:hypothetical protein
MTTPQQKFYVDIDAGGGDLRVFEDELASINNDDAVLMELGISRADLCRSFAEAKELMEERGLEPGGRIRPVVDQAADGSWYVVLLDQAC